MDDTANIFSEDAIEPTHINHAKTNDNGVPCFSWFFALTREFSANDKKYQIIIMSKNVDKTDYYNFAPQKSS